METGYLNWKTDVSTSSRPIILDDNILYDIQETFYDIHHNFPNKKISKLILLSSFPRGRKYIPVDDKTKKEISDEVTKDSCFRHDILLENIHISKNCSYVISEV